MIKSKHILFLGKRLDALKAARQLGVNFSVVHNKEIKKQKKYFEICISEESDFFDETLKKLPQDITHVIPITEYGVRIYERVLKQINLQNTISSNIQQCFNKSLMKKHALMHNIPIAKYLEINNWDANKILTYLGTDVVVKQIASSGSRGQYFLNTQNDILKCTETDVLVEERIKGTEFSIESFVKNNKVIFTNITSYFSHHTCNVLPFQLDIQSEALILNKKIINAFEIQNAMTHIEFYRTSNGLIFGEIAIRSPGGYIMSLLDLAYNFSSWKTLINIFLKDDLVLPQETVCFSACWIIHPGKGNLNELPDFTKVQEDPSFVDIKNALKKGTIEERLGSGEDYGRIILKNNNYNDLLKSLENIEKYIKYDLSDTRTTD